MRKEKIENYHMVSTEYKREVVQKMWSKIKWKSHSDESGKLHFCKELLGEKISRDSLMDFPIIDMESKEVQDHIKKGVRDGWFRIRKKRGKNDDYVISGDENTSPEERHAFLLYREDGVLKAELIKQNGMKRKGKGNSSN